MTCKAAFSAFDDTRLTPTERVIFGNICKGYQTRAAIAKATGCAESSVPRAMRKLESMGYLKRQFTEGKANTYLVFERPQTSSDTGISQDTGIRTTRIKSPRGIAPDTGVHHPTDTGLPVDKSLAHIRHARARAETPINITTTLELYPESPESSGEVAARAKQSLVDRVCDAVNSPWLDPNKSAGLVTTSPLLGRWAQSLDIDTELIPLFKAKIACNGHDAISSWKYFRGAVEDMIALKTQPESSRNDRQPASASELDGLRIRREPVSPATAARKRRQAEREARREPIELGRVASIRLD